MAKTTKPRKKAEGKKAADLVNISQTNKHSEHSLSCREAGSLPIHRHGQVAERSAPSLRRHTSTSS
jgi:hypothetical protein